MGTCCHSAPPPEEEKDGAFSDFTKNRTGDHHNGDSNYTLTSIHKDSVKSNTRYYKSRQAKSTQSLADDIINDINDNDTNLKGNASSSSSSSSSTNSHPLLNDPNAAAKKQLIKTNKLAVSSSSPSPNTKSATHSNQPQLSPPHKSHSDHHDERQREVSVSKSRSRQFRPRNEPKTSSPNTKPSKSPKIPLQTKHNLNMAEPPEIDDDDDDEDEEIEDEVDRGSNASSLSDDMQIPVLLFSDSADDEEDGNNDDEDDGNMKIMEYLVEQENKRLEQEIVRMKSYMEEQETIKLKAEALKEIEAELAKQKRDNMENVENVENVEEEKKRKAMERYEKKQRQRQKEKEEAKERRRIKKEEKKKKEIELKKKQKAKLLRKKMAQRQAQRMEDLKKKRKEKDLDGVPEEERPTRQHIHDLFDKYFWKPWEEKMSGLSYGEQIKMGYIIMRPRNAVSLDAFKVGLETLGIDTLLSQDEMDNLFEELKGKHRGVNANDFIRFLKGKDVRDGVIQKKVLNAFAEQQDKEDLMEDRQSEGSGDTVKIRDEDTNDTKDIGMDDDEEENGHHHVHFAEDVEDKSDVNKIGNMPSMKVLVSEPFMSNDSIIVPVDNDDDGGNGNKHRPITPLSHHSNGAYQYPSDVIQPIDSMRDLNANNDVDTDEDDVDDMEEDEMVSVEKPNSVHSANRRQSISMSESMSMSVSQFVPSNIPRKSFKTVNYTYSDTISKKSFNNYKRLREKFAFRYKHTPRRNQTRDEELINIREKILTEALNGTPINEQQEDNGDDEDEENNQNEEKQEEKQDDIKADTASNNIIINVDNQEKLNGIKEEEDDQEDEKNNDNNKQHRITISKSRSQRGRLLSLSGKQQDGGNRVSVVASLKKIEGYEGNEQMMNLRKLYKQQYKMKRKLEKLRKQSLLGFPAPPKPKNVEAFIDDHTRYMCKELKSCLCKNTRYTGLANFGPNGELGIELEITSDPDDNGYITGKRVIHFRGMKQAIGKGRIWTDIIWNGHKYVPCARFEWTDDGEGVTTKLEFNSVKHELDVDHSFFQGKCLRYPSDLNPKRRSTKLIMHEGFFDFVCVSARRRNIRRGSMLQYHTLDVNEMNDDELAKVPKYVRRMSAYADKIDKLYNQDAPVTKDSLFGDALAITAAINETDPITSDASIPEPINN